MLFLQWPSSDVLRASYCSAGKFVCTSERWCHQKRTVDTYVLFLGCKNSVYLRQGDKEYVLEPDGYLILLADTEHEGTRPSAPEYYWCHFTLPSEVKLSSRAESDCALPIQGKLHSPESQRLLFCRMAQSTAKNKGLRKTLRNRLLEALLLDLLCGESAPPPSPLASNVVNYLRVNAAQVQTVGEIAQHFGYNKEYLTTLMKKSTGKSLWEHLLFFRLEKAKELLLQTDLPASQIAYACGFRDVKYFSRLFHKHTGFAPTHYRNSRPHVPWNNR